MSLHPTTQQPKEAALAQRFLTVTVRFLTIFVPLILGFVACGITSLVLQILADNELNNSADLVVISIVVTVVVWTMVLLTIAVAIAMFLPAPTDS